MRLAWMLVASKLCVCRNCNASRMKTRWLSHLKLDSVEMDAIPGETLAQVRRSSLRRASVVMASRTLIQNQQGRHPMSDRKLTPTNPERKRNLATQYPKSIEELKCLQTALTVSVGSENRSLVLTEPAASNCCKGMDRSKRSHEKLLSPAGKGGEGVYSEAYGG